MNTPPPPPQGVPLSLKHRSVSVSSHSTCLHSPDCAPISMVMIMLVTVNVDLFNTKFQKHHQFFVSVWVYATWREFCMGWGWRRAGVIYFEPSLSLSSVGGGHHQHWTLAGLHHRNGGAGVIYIYIPRYLWHPIVNNRLWWNFWMLHYFEPWCWRMTSARHQTLERLHHDISAPSLYLDSLSISDGFILQIVLNVVQYQVIREHVRIDNGLIWNSHACYLLEFIQRVRLQQDILWDGFQMRDVGE